MGLSRRFLNLIVESEYLSTKSLRRIDLKRLQLFYPTTPPATRPPTMEYFGLPSPNPILQACSEHAVGNWRIACHTLGERKVLCTDQCARNFLYDTSTHQMTVMPEFHMPRLNSLSHFIPSREGKREEGPGEGEDEDAGGSLFLIDDILDPVQSHGIGHPATTSSTEVLFCGNGSVTPHCKLLPPPPPFSTGGAPSKIDSYAVVGDGSHVCISVNGRGTYFLDTARHTWDKVGDWTLPFLGKVHYVPELKLWFGLAADAEHLAAADLSTTSYQPQLVDGRCKEFHPPEGWYEVGNAQLVNLGSARFCITRCFRCYDYGDDTSVDIAVLTGLEVRPCVLNGNGKVKLQMIPHKSMCNTAPPGIRNIISSVF